MRTMDKFATEDEQVRSLLDRRNHIRDLRLKSERVLRQSLTDFNETN